MIKGVEAEDFRMKSSLPIMPPFWTWRKEGNCQLGWEIETIWTNTKIFNFLFYFYWKKIDWKTYDRTLFQRIIIYIYIYYRQAHWKKRSNHHTILKSIYLFFNNFKYTIFSLIIFHIFLKKYNLSSLLNKSYISFNFSIVSQFQNIIYFCQAE